MTHICVDNLTIIGSDNGLLPGRHQAIIWNNAGLLLIGPCETNFSEIVIEILTFSFKKMHLKVLSAKRRPFCLGLNVLTHSWCVLNIVYISKSKGWKRCEIGMKSVKLTHWGCMTHIFHHCKPQIWPISSQRVTIMRKIHRARPKCLETQNFSHFVKSK